MENLPISMLEQRTRYLCKKCNAMTTAESFEQIIEREKLCPCCIRMAKEMKRLFQPGQSLAKTTIKTKRIISNKNNYECMNCGNITLAVIKPAKCVNCNAITFKIRKKGTK